MTVMDTRKKPPRCQNKPSLSFRHLCVLVRASVRVCECLSISVGIVQWESKLTNVCEWVSLKVWVFTYVRVYVRACECVCTGKPRNSILSNYVDVWEPRQRRKRRVAWRHLVLNECSTERQTVECNNCCTIIGQMKLIALTFKHLNWRTQKP